MTRRDQIKQRLRQDRWSVACDRLIDFLKFLREKYPDRDISPDDVAIVDSSDAYYLDRKNRQYDHAVVLKIGSRLHWSYWRYAIYSRAKKEED